VAVEAAKAVTGTISLIYSYAGTLQPQDSVKVLPLISGHVASLNVNVGDDLKAGDVICTLETDTLQAQVDQAQAAYNAAYQKLVAEQVGSRPEEITAAQAALTAAQVALDAVVSPTSDQMTVAAEALENARATLQQAQANYDKVASEANIAMSPQALALQAATNDYQSALSAYNLATKPTSGTLAPLQNNVAQAQLKLAETQVAYLPTDLAEAQATADQAKAALDLAKITLGEATIQAPFDGVVAEVYVSKGDLVGPTTPVVLFLSNSNQVALDIEESRISQIKIGESAALQVSAYPGSNFAAKVTSIAPMADAKTHTFQIFVTPEDNTHLLLAGMYADVSLLVAQHQHTLLVPQAAIVQGPQNQNQVYVVRVNNTAQLLTVTVGLSDQNNVEILSGLKPGATVVTAGQGNLIEGANVTVARAAS
jgi:RND family efflux transporter MFP subunit